MKDDYLWDKTGTPDPDIEYLERTLRSFRSQPAPLRAFPRRRRPWFAAGVATAAALVLALGLWAWRHTPAPTGTAAVATPAAVRTPADPASMEEPITVYRPVWKNVAQTRKEPFSEHPLYRVSASSLTPEEETAPTVSDPARQQELAAHIEKIELLLRAFRNTGMMEADLFYEQQQARELLAQNTLLRFISIAEGDASGERLLDDLEVYLLDIANLPVDDRAAYEVSSIKDRINDQEILASLSLYGR